MSLLSDALFTETQQQVLGLLYGQPDKTFYTKQILRATGMGVATIKRELERMLAAGILQMNKVGNQHHYQANPECPIYEELLGITRKTFGVADVIRDSLAPLLSDIDMAFIYGSVAKHEDSSSSDIDVMVISDRLSYTDVMDLCLHAETKLGRPVNPSVYDKKQITEKLSQKASFLTRVMEQPKIWLKGIDDDISVFREPG